MKVFLSYSTPIRYDQKALFSKIKQILNSQDVDLKIVANVQSVENPISTIITTLENCDGLLCLAFEKYCSVENNQLIYHTSSWLDVEIALALQRAMPVLVLKEKHIGKSPLIDCNKTPYTILDIETNYYNDSFEIDNVNFEHNIIPAIKLWIEQQVYL